jgi:hypothetical protein
MRAGHPTVDNPDNRAAMKRAHELCERYGVPLARFLYPPFDESVRKAIRDGARVLVAGGDVSLLMWAAETMVKAKG